MVKGGAALPHELMIRTRFGSAADVFGREKKCKSPQRSRQGQRIARAALSRCHKTVTCQT